MTIMRNHWVAFITDEATFITAKIIGNPVIERTFSSNEWWRKGADWYNVTESIALSRPQSGEGVCVINSDYMNVNQTHKGHEKCTFTWWTLFHHINVVSGQNQKKCSLWRLLVTLCTLLTIHWSLRWYKTSGWPTPAMKIIIINARTKN